MKRPRLFTTVAVVAIIAAAPSRAASPALVFGVIAGVAVVVAIAQPGRDAWAYSQTRGWVGGAREDVSAVDAPLAPQQGTPQRFVNACRDAVARNAQRYDVASLEAVSAGRPTRIKGRTLVPVEIRAIYRVRGVHEVRRTQVRCEIDRAGRVLATS
jgi:hypothetical protein